MRDAHDEGREHERRDDHLDQAQKDVREQRNVISDALGDFRIGPKDVARITDENTEYHADQDYRRELRTHSSSPIPGGVRLET
jgi:hypothetical protein